jgi:seryl-tRNA synthetase
MLDINYIRNNPEVIQKAAKDKNLNLDLQLLLNTDKQRRKMIAEISEYYTQRNKLKNLIPDLQGEEKEKNIQQIKEINNITKALKNQLKVIEESFTQLMLLVPSIPFEDVPVGTSDEDNVLLYEVGTKRDKNETLFDHIELGKRCDIFDIEKSADVSGSRMYFLKHNGVILQRAIEELVFDELLKTGFSFMEVPVMVKEDSMTKTGYFPNGKEDAYELTKDNMYLVGSAEVPLVAYYSNKKLREEDLPIKVAAVSTCFRREAGSYGRDTKGLYRVHQFRKVEQVIICKDDINIDQEMHKLLLANAENILKKLEFPYRVVEVCTGDMGQGQVKKHDIEVWMPSRESYGETHSCSSFLDFQARRADIKYRDSEGSLAFAYTLNNTAIAFPRILIPFLENHQTTNGNIKIPSALKPYLGGKDFLL